MTMKSCESVSNFGKTRYEYRCSNVFTEKPEWLDEKTHGVLNFGIITCPGKDCHEKVGTYSSQGMKCQTCHV